MTTSCFLLVGTCFVSFFKRHMRERKESRESMCYGFAIRGCPLTFGADIDFAHFLGNVLRFGPINRDKAPFVLTPEMAYVMGGRCSLLSLSLSLSLSSSLLLLLSLLSSLFSFFLSLSLLGGFLLFLFVFLLFSFSLSLGLCGVSCIHSSLLFFFFFFGRESPQFNEFIDLCCRAYNILRKHTNLFIALFYMVSHRHPQQSFFFFQNIFYYYY